MDGFNKPRPDSRTILSATGFSEAFNSVWHPAIFHKLILAGLPLCFARWTQSFLSDRRACVVFQDHKSRSFRVRRGVPQAFVLGPVLFFLFRLLFLLPSAAPFTLKAKFFPRLKALRCISASSCGPSKESLSLLYKSFLRSLLTYASPGWFPFLSATNLTKSERLHRAASRTITGCLSSSPIPLLLSEASLLPLRVTLTHFILSSYERALRLLISFPISGLARLGVKSRLCRSSRRAFASTHQLMLPSASPREALLACPPFPPWNLPSFTVEITLFSSCSRSDLPLSRQGATLSYLDSLSPIMIWYSGQTGLFFFLLARAAPAFLPTAFSVAQRPLFPFQETQNV